MAVPHVEAPRRRLEPMKLRNVISLLPKILTWNLLLPLNIEHEYFPEIILYEAITSSTDCRLLAVMMSVKVG